jgi:hypothetical protein
MSSKRYTLRRQDNPELERDSWRMRERKEKEQGKNAILRRPMVKTPRKWTLEMQDPK